MQMTIDDSLREVNRWKKEVSERTAAMSVAERVQAGKEAIAWLEAKLGRPLKRYPVNSTVRKPPVR